MAPRRPIRTKYPWARNYRELVRRWKEVAPLSGLRMKAFSEASGHKLYYLETRKPVPNAPHIFLSAGIHGDEPAPPVALLEWVTRNPKRAAKLNLVLFPCLNPWGIIHNIRTDAEGRDLNRTYQNDVVPQTAAHLALLRERRFDVGVTLHEDYDAEGVYLYELRKKKPFWGPAILKAAGRHLPIDSRGCIEKSRAKSGFIHRNIDLDFMPERPEALQLFFFHATRALTIETPSEYLLDHRVDALVDSVAACIRLCALERRVSP